MSRPDRLTLDRLTDERQIPFPSRVGAAMIPPGRDGRIGPVSLASGPILRTGPGEVGNYAVFANDDHGRLFVGPAAGGGPVFVPAQT